MKACRDCGRQFPDDELSRQKLCRECSDKRVQASIDQMRARSGPVYERWRRHYLAAVPYAVMNTEV